ncbi:MAG TPA: hypothetical protein VMX55_08615 [candidate division Zixibacteria bacterium]|nr:hypothetical protein [candidate division Zixibacteria bacterium]
MNLIIANRINNLVANDPAKIAILNLLSDGKWHTRFEVESIAKDYRPTIGLVGICVILKSLQDADSQLFEVYDNDSGVFYRLNPQRTEIIQKIITHQTTKISKETKTTSATEFKKFKEKVRMTRKSEKDQDDDLKHFL